MIACGVSVSEGTLQAGLLFISAELDPQPYKLFDVDSGERVSVTLPEQYLNLKEDVCKRNIQLKVRD